MRWQGEAEIGLLQAIYSINALYVTWRACVWVWHFLITCIFTVVEEESSGGCMIGGRGSASAPPTGTPSYGNLLSSPIFHYRLYTLQIYVPQLEHLPNYSNPTYPPPPSVSRPPPLWSPLHQFPHPHPRRLLKCLSFLHLTWSSQSMAAQCGSNRIEDHSPEAWAPIPPWSAGPTVGHLLPFTRQYDAGQAVMVISGASAISDGLHMAGVNDQEMKMERPE